MKTKLISILLALVIFLPSCSDSKGDEPKGCEDEGWLPYESLDVSRSEREIISQQNDFSYNLFKKLYEKPAYQQGNFILSPLSASMSLSMMANGAKGETRDEILDVLGFEDANLEEVNTFNKRLCEELAKVDRTSKISLANSIWINKDFPVYESFISDNQEAYGAEIFNEELWTENTRQAINAWASDKTNGLIPGVLNKPLDPRTMIFLMNALYFKGKWGKTFDKSLTAQGDFHNADGTVSHPMMMNGRDYSYFACYDDEGASWLNISFGNGAYELMVILPDEGVSLKDYLAGVTKEEFFVMYDNNIWKSYDGDLVFPIFEINSEFYLDDIMKELGIKKAFSTQNADFSLISQEKTAISKIKQDARIIFDEEGAELSSTVDMSGWASMPLPLPVVDLKIDRPFAFMLRENSFRSILFMGCVNKL